MIPDKPPDAAGEADAVVVSLFAIPRFFNIFKNENIENKDAQTQSWKVEEKRSFLRGETWYRTQLKVRGFCVSLFKGSLISRISYQLTNVPEDSRFVL